MKKRCFILLLITNLESLFTRNFRIRILAFALAFFLPFGEGWGGASFAQNKTIDSLLIILSEGVRSPSGRSPGPQLHDTTKVNALSALGWEYKYTKPDTSYIILKQALSLAQKINFKKGEAAALRSIGGYNFNKADYPQALQFYFSSLKISESINDKLGIAKPLGNIGNVYTSQADYPKALEYYFKALKMAEELGNKNSIANNLGNIGNVYKNQADFPKALEYYFKALKMAEELGAKDNITIILGSIGSLYTKTGKFAEAEKYLKHSLALCDSIGALDYTKNFEKSLSELYDTLATLKEQNFSKVSNFGKVGLLRKLAFAHYKKYIAARDSIANDEQKKKQLYTEMNYEFETKQTQQKAEQDKKDTVAAEEKRKQKIIIWSVMAGLLLVIVFAGFIFRSLRVTRKQKIVIEKSKQIIEEKNKDITDSITYAKRIQRAMLPHRRDIWAAFPQSFILFKPKDIVSGDFYWFHKIVTKNERRVAGEFPSSQSSFVPSPLFIAAVDCTGHGVPGAFMSMVGAGQLNDAVSKSSDTSEILSLLNKGIKTALKQSGGEEATRDGMDIALCALTPALSKGEGAILHYAGANRPLWIIRKGETEVEEIKATKKAIGGFTEDDQHFDTHEIKLQQGDTFYVFTDGYADQFGGTSPSLVGRAGEGSGKKIMTKKMKEILLETQNMTMKEQERHLNNFVENWKRGREQVDDILVIGVRI